MNADLVLTSRRVVTPTGTRAAAIVVHRGKILEVAKPGTIPKGFDVQDFQDLVIMPGLVDTHVHINEPGRTEWEGFRTATRAAAAGGVTTLVDMPLNSIPATTTVTAFEEKLAAAHGQLWVDTGFWGGVVADHEHQLWPLAAAGVLGFKCFLVPSGVAEFPHVSPAAVRRVLPTLHAMELPLLVHAEMPQPLDEAMEALELEKADPHVYQTYLRSRPPEAEVLAIDGLIRFAERYHTHIHIVHLATGNAVAMLRDARARGVPITVETCPHYLYFSAEEISARATEFKCAPPIRDAANRDALWNALAEGVIDFVVSDHSPCPPKKKTSARGDFFKAWGGISSLQLRLPAVWAGARARNYSLDQLSGWLSTAPAELAGLGSTKGAIAVGYDADFVVWDPDAERVLEPNALHHRHKLTPYVGRTLPGVVRATYLRGERIYDGANVVAKPSGKTLLRSS